MTDTRVNIWFIVVREKNFKPFEKVPGRDPWGWKLLDGIEIDNYKEAKRLLEEYSKSMPDWIVRLRATYKMT